MRATVRTGIWSTLLTAACGAAALTLSAQGPRQVDDATLLKPPVEEWITYGRDYAETHHSPLTGIAPLITFSGSPARFRKAGRGSCCEWSGIQHRRASRRPRTGRARAPG